jgi:GNS1/SUR4 family
MMTDFNTTLFPVPPRPQVWEFTYEYMRFGKYEYTAPVPLIVAAVTAIAYLVLIKVIAPMWKPSDAAFHKWRYRHNVALASYSAFASLYTIWYMYTENHFESFESAICKPGVGATYELVYLSFTLSKAWEWLDSVWLVWKGKQLSFLHSYHHMTTLWLFLLCVNQPTGTKGGMILNGAVHAFMYHHYAHPWPKSMRPLLTMMQIVQLFACTVFWLAAPYYMCPNYGFFVREKWWDYATPILFVPVYLIAFAHFFLMRYVFDKWDKPASKKTKKA